MSKKDYIKNLTKHEVECLASKCSTKTEMLTLLGVQDNGTYSKLLNNILNKYNITIKRKPVKYPLQTKICPVCGSAFSTYIGRKDEKTTCSHSCSNTYFNGIIRNTNPTNYATICFRYHKKECIVCGENRIVEVHHFDEDHQNNSPENLIPLCPTHHKLYHSRFRKDVEPQIIQYQQNYVLSSGNPTNRFIVTSL